MSERSTKWWSEARRPRAPFGWKFVDAGVAALFLVLLVPEITPNPEMTPQAPLLVLTVALAVSMAWLSSHPAFVAIAVSTVHLAMCVISTGQFAPQLTVVPLLWVLFSAASRTRGLPGFVTGALTLALMVAAWVVTDQGDGDDFWPYLLWAGCWASGTFVRRREDLAAQHAARAALLEGEARTTAAQSAQAERDRIARELHDVVAHSVSVMVVQAGAERLRLGPDAGRTHVVLEAIEASGRLALTELRTMLGVVREGAPEELVPLPGMAAVPGLVERVREAGLPVELNGSNVTSRIDGELVVDDAVSLAAYRIVQEALTNVLRHAGAVPTQVELRHDDGRLSVSVRNALGKGGTGPGSGRGLNGMSERARALGGTFSAGPADGAFVVCAVLPARTTTVPAVTRR